MKQPGIVPLLERWWLWDLGRGGACADVSIYQGSKKKEKKKKKKKKSNNNNWLRMPQILWTFNLGY